MSDSTITALTELTIPYITDLVPIVDNTGAAITKKIQIINLLGRNVVSKSSNYTLTLNDNICLVTGATTITLPTAVGIQGTKFSIKRMDATNTTTINTTAAQTIDGVTSKTLISQYQSMTVRSDGSNYFIL